jgi:hypothetical protein
LGDEVHVNFFVFRRTPVQDDGTVIRAGLRQAVDLFRNPGEYSLEHYGIGPQAYDNWIAGAEAFGASHGNWWNATVWSECRAMAADWFAEIAGNFPSISGPAGELSTAYEAIGAMLAQVSGKEMPPGEKVSKLQELKLREATAVQKIEELIRGFAA